MMAENFLTNQSPLIDTHKMLGATFLDDSGSQMPARYGSIEEEIHLVRNQVGLMDLSNTGIIKIGGSEGAQFLQGLVSNDVKMLQVNQGVRAAFLTGHGKVKAFCLIIKLENEYLVINDPQTHQKIFNYVFPFSYAGDFLVEDISSNLKILSIQGPNALLVLKEVSFEPVELSDNYSWMKTVIADHQVIIIKHSRTGELGFDLVVPGNGLIEVWDFLMMKGKFHSLATVGLNALDILRIEAGVPKYGLDIDESNMLLEANLEDIVSFTKGCYTGQEAVAMATYRGHVSKKLTGILMDEKVSIETGDQVFSGDKEIGKIASFASSPTLRKKIALSCIKYGYFDKAIPVEIRTAQGIVEGNLTQLPFIH
ncbi:MAG: aminomethyltransferase family protein [Acidobacteriota bacterium]